MITRAIAFAITTTLAVGWVGIPPSAGTAFARPTPRTAAAPVDLAIEHHTIGNRKYTIFRQNHPCVRLTLTRPNRTDRRVVLAVAGTYTSPQDTVEGFVVLNGRIVQMRERQGWDGAVVLRNCGMEILRTNRGHSLTRPKLHELARGGASLVQVHLLVHEGKAVWKKPQPPFQRRALATLASGSPVIIESTAAMDLVTFARDLVTLGARNAVNLDMGRWDEGWYRHPNIGNGKVITIGTLRTATRRQSNWITLTQ